MGENIWHYLHFGNILVERDQPPNGPYVLNVCLDYNGFEVKIIIFFIIFIRAEQDKQALCAKLETSKQIIMNFIIKSWLKNIGQHSNK